LGNGGLEVGFLINKAVDFRSKLSIFYEK